MKTATVGTEGIALYTVEIPETVEQAQARFVCAPMNCDMTGRACAMRHRKWRGATAAEIGCCGSCPAGAARLDLIGDMLKKRHTTALERILAKGANGRARIYAGMLEALEEADAPITATQLHHRIGMPRGSRYDYLRALIEDGRVIKFPGHVPTYTIAKAIAAAQPSGAEGETCECE